MSTWPGRATVRTRSLLPGPVHAPRPATARRPSLLVLVPLTAARYLAALHAVAGLAALAFAVAGVVDALRYPRPHGLAVMAGALVASLALVALALVVVLATRPSVAAGVGVVVGLGAGVMAVVLQGRGFDQGGFYVDEVPLARTAGAALLACAVTALVGRRLRPEPVVVRSTSPAPADGVHAAPLRPARVLALLHAVLAVAGIVVAAGWLVRDVVAPPPGSWGVGADVFFVAIPALVVTVPLLVASLVAAGSRRAVRVVGAAVFAAAWTFGFASWLAVDRSQNHVWLDALLVAQVASVALLVAALAPAVASARLRRRA